MAWWDHEELKSHKDRSNRYILAFPSEYTPKEVQKAMEEENAKRLQKGIPRVSRQEGPKETKSPA